MAKTFDCAALLEFHRRLSAGDRFVREDFARAFLPQFLAKTARYFPECDADFVHDGTIDAFLDFCGHPETFDPDGAASLDTFLLNAARRNADNRIVSERRLKARERRVAEQNPEICVALDPAARSISTEEQIRRATHIEAILAALNERDREFFSLYLQGERNVPAYARVLQIEHLPIERQRQEVKRHRNRIWAKLKRKGVLRVL